MIIFLPTGVLELASHSSKWEKTTSNPSRCQWDHQARQDDITLRPTKLWKDYIVIDISRKTGRRSESKITLLFTRVLGEFF